MTTALSALFIFSLVFRINCRQEKKSLSKPQNSTNYEIFKASCCVFLHIVFFTYSTITKTKKSIQNWSEELALIFVGDKIEMVLHHPS